MPGKIARKPDRFLKPVRFGPKKPISEVGNRIFNYATRGVLDFPKTRIQAKVKINQPLWARNLIIYIFHTSMNIRILARTTQKGKAKENSFFGRCRPLSASDRYHDTRWKNQSRFAEKVPAN
jgi:hypothetical protein